MILATLDINIRRKAYFNAGIFTILEILLGSSLESTGPSLGARSTLVNRVPP